MSDRWARIEAPEATACTMSPASLVAPARVSTKTRERRIGRTVEELLEGKKRPCCWAGCIHRTDKAPSRWQQAVLIDKKAGKPGPKRWGWVKKGAPIILEIGGRDAAGRDHVHERIPVADLVEVHLVDRDAVQPAFGLG